jgi:tetratricopeptide (TPR) repeat protein
LNLLGNYLAQCTDDHDIRGWQERFPILREDERIHPVADAVGKRAGHGRRMLRAYERWLGPQSAPMAMLRLLGLFDRPARSDLLDELRAAPVIEGLTEALVDLPNDEWLRTLNQLQNLGLINRDAISPSQEAGITEEQSVPSTSVISNELVDTFLQRDDFPEELRKLSKPELKELMGRALSAKEQADTSAKRPRRPVNHIVDAHPLLREHFAAELKEQHADAWRASHRRLYEYLCDTTPNKATPTLEDLQPLYQAVAHGCKAGLQQDACDKVYWDRIQRKSKGYSFRNLGAFGSELGAVACFFEQPWTRLSSSLPESDQAWLLNVAAYHLRALGQLTEALGPMRVSGEMDVKAERLNGAATSYSNLSELELTLGELIGAVADAQHSVVYAERSGDSFLREATRTTLADALHQAGRRAEAETRFREAEAILIERQPKALLYGVSGFEFCDLFLATSERAAWQIVFKRDGKGPGNIASLKAPSPVRADDSLQRCRVAAQRADQALQIVLNGSRSLLDIALNHLTMGRTALYEAVLERSATLRTTATPNNPAASVSSNALFIADSAAHHRLSLQTARRELYVAVEGLRLAGTMHFLPSGLLSRAWQHFLESYVDRAQEDLDEAWEIAERGPMRLFMADIHLYRARLFNAVKPYPWNKNPDGTERGAKDDLKDARKLIEQCGYWRRKEELEDAEEAAKNWK